jgi:XapX domain-containing protein
MKVYVVSIAAGVLVGIVYGLLHVRSPAPPLVALCGLLGILVGEQLVPLVQRALRGDPVTLGWLANDCAPKITGVPPSPSAPVPTTSDAGPTKNP